MKLKYEFIINQVADNFVAMPVGDDIDAIGGFLKMNDVGAYIFKMLSNDVTEEEIVIAMAHDFPEEPEEEIRKVVTGFVKRLKKDDLVI